MLEEQGWKNDSYAPTPHSRSESESVQALEGTLDSGNEYSTMTSLVAALWLVVISFCLAVLYSTAFLVLGTNVRHTKYYTSYCTSLLYCHLTRIGYGRTSVRG